MMYKTIIHGCYIKHIKNSSFSKQMISCVYSFHGLSVNGTKTSHYVAVDIPFSKISSPHSHSKEFSHGVLVSSSSSSIMISMARQVRLQNAFSPLQDIKEANLRINFYASNQLLHPVHFIRDIRDTAVLSTLSNYQIHQLFNVPKIALFLIKYIVSMRHHGLRHHRHHGLRHHN